MELNNEARQELYETLDVVPLEVVERTLQRIEAGRIEGRFYAAGKGNGVRCFAGDAWQYIPQRNLVTVANDKTLFVFSEGCGCLKGTLAIEAGCVPDDIAIRACFTDMGIKRNTYGALETFVYQIHYGDTPETSEASDVLREAVAGYIQNRSEVKGE